MPGMHALIKWSMPRLMGETTRGKSPGPSASYSYGTGKSGGQSYDKRSQPSQNVFSKEDKDWIPLVEVSTKDVLSAPSEFNNEWPLRMNDSAAWQEPKAPRRASLKRHSLNGGGRAWKVSMDA
jgi:hypothetical protein